MSTRNMEGIDGFFEGKKISNWRMTIGNNFGVTSDGSLYASAAKISGDITAASLFTIYDASFGIRKTYTSLGGLETSLEYTNGYRESTLARDGAISVVRYNPSNTMTAQAVLQVTSNNWAELYAIYGKLSGTWYDTSGSTIITSWRGAKHDIEDLSDKYSVMFDNLKPVRFKYNNGQSNRYHTGIMLDELKTAMDIAGVDNSELAAYCVADETTGEGGIRYSELVPLNTYEIQKLKARVAKLEAQQNNSGE